MNHKTELWLLKDTKGKIFGPYEYGKLFLFIEKGMISGDEMISRYPNGDWQSISKDLDLNEKLLEQLVKQTETKSREEIEADLEGYSEIINVESEPSFTEARDVEPIMQADEDWAEEKPEEPSRSVSFTSKTIEVQNKFYDKRRFGRFLIVLALLAIVFIHLSERGDGPDSSIIIAPTQSTTINRDFSNQEKQESLKSVMAFYMFGEKENYLKSRDVLLRVIEKDHTITEAIASLCMIYHELWPYSQKTLEDKAVISQLVQMSTVVETYSSAAMICKSVQSIIDGDYTRARGFIERVLTNNTEAAEYYYLLANIEKDLGNHQRSIQNYQAASNRAPNWLNPKIYEGESRQAIGQIEIARQLWLQALSIGKSNESAAILLAHSDLYEYQNQVSAQNYIGAFKKAKSGASPRIQAKGFEVLAGLAEYGQERKAVDFAQQALYLDSKAHYARAILERKGEKAYINTKTTAEAYIASGDLLASQNRFFEAQAEYKTAFELDSKNSVAALKAAKSLWKMDQQQEAIAWLRKSMQADPKNFEAALELALYYGERYDFLAASKQLVQAQKINARDYRIYQTYARLEYLRRNYTSAIKNAEIALKRYDAAIESLYILADANMQLGNYREAHYATAKAVELEANNSLSQSKYALTLSKFQSSRAGIDYITNLVNTYPSDLNYRMGLAKVYFHNDRFDSALAVLKQIEVIVPNKKEFYLLMAEVYESISDYSNTLKSLLSAAASSPSDTNIYVKIGELHLRAKKYADALEQFLVAEKLNDNYPRLNTMLGEANLRLGRYDKAMEYAQKEILRNPKLADGYLLAGEIYSANGQYSKAAGQFQRVIQINPNSANLYVKIARAHRLAGNHDLARSMLSVAAEKESGNAEIYKESGALLEITGNRQEAISAYKRYLQLSPAAGDIEEIKRIINGLGG